MQKINKFFRLTSDSVAARAIEIITLLPKDGTVDILIHDHKEDRSLKQHRLRWLWMSTYAGEHGITKDRANKEWKYRFVLPILIRDDEHGGLQALLDRAKTESLIMEQFVDLIHASDLSMAQYAEALTEFDNWAGSHGFIMPHPDDIYSEAMGT